MENVICNCGQVKLTEFNGNYYLYTVRAVNYDGIVERELALSATVLSSGYVRMETTGRLNNVGSDNFNAEEYAKRMYKMACERLGI